MAKVAGAQVRGVAADLGTQDGVATFLNDAPTADILVNNLGIFEVKPFAEITDDDWLRFFKVNVLSGVRLARHYLPGMREKNWGRVIFISSESAVNIPVEMIHYGMTKTAQVAVARGLAESVAGTGITVNSILVGPTESEGVGNFLQEMARQQGVTPAQVEKEFFEKARPSSLLKRFETARRSRRRRSLRRQRPRRHHQRRRRPSRGRRGAVGALTQASVMPTLIPRGSERPDVEDGGAVQPTGAVPISNVPPRLPAGIAPPRWWRYA